MTDIVMRLKKSIDEHAPVSVEDLRAAVAEIEHLRRIAGHPRMTDEHIAAASQVVDRLMPRVVADMNLEARLARLERSVRDNTRRLDLAYRALHDAPCLSGYAEVGLHEALEPTMEDKSDV